MANTNLTDTFTLISTGEYARPKDQNAYLPVVYGDMTENSDDSGMWAAPCIDTESFVYAIAGHAILTEENGNIIRCFDSDGDEITNFAVTTGAAYGTGLNNIAYLTFSSDPGDITVQCKGKTTDDGTLITNPISIIEDILGDATNIDNTSFSASKIAATEQGYTSAGVIADEAAYNVWTNSIAASFLMDVYVNGAGKIVARIDTASTQNLSPSAFFVQRNADNIRGTQVTSNLCNQVTANYAIAYESDKRYKEGTRSNYRRTENGSTFIDTLSQTRYGIRTKTFNLDWIRNTATANKIQSRIVSQYKDPLWLYHWEDITMSGAKVEKGDIIVFSWEERIDEDGNALVNQYAKVIEKDIDLDSGTIKFNLRDLNVVLAAEPDIWDGIDATTGDGGKFGGDRNTEGF